VEIQKPHFEEELEQLKTHLLVMSALVESAVYRSITAVVQRDRKMAEEVVQNESRVDRLQIEIDEQAIRLACAPLTNGERSAIDHFRHQDQ